MAKIANARQFDDSRRSLQHGLAGAEYPIQTAHVLTIASLRANIYCVLVILLETVSCTVTLFHTLLINPLYQAPSSFSNF
jgi:hypothetical protein